MKDETINNLAHQRHMKKMWRAVYILVAIAAILGVYFWVSNLPPPSGLYDSFAQCIASSGATFYGAFWCPHCQDTKALFGDSERLLPYVECSPNGPSQPQTKVCTDAGVESYPTWVFKDGSRLTGEQSLTTLAEKTGCPLPMSTGK